jgi:hypothetical protein
MRTSVIALQSLPVCSKGSQRLELGLEEHDVGLPALNRPNRLSIRVAALTQALDFSRQPWTFAYISRVLAMAQSSKERWLSRPETLMPRIQMFGAFPIVHRTKELNVDPLCQVWWSYSSQTKIWLLAWRRHRERILVHDLEYFGAKHVDLRHIDGF